MKFKTFHKEYDTKRVRVNSQTETAYKILCENVRELTENETYNYIIKFMNSALVDTFCRGLTIDNYILFKTDDEIQEKINHLGFTECGYWFEANGAMVVKVINDIYRKIPINVSKKYANHIGQVFCDMLKE